MPSSDWIAFWDTKHPIYVNDRHRAAHFRRIADDIARYVPEGGSATMLDYGCGEALSADRVAEKAARLILCEPAPNVRGTLASRFAGNSRIAVRKPEDIATMPAQSLDIVVMHSVLQYLSATDFDALLALFYRLLKPGGLFMNHAIVSLHREDTQPISERVKARLWKRNAFIQKYVFPEGKLVPIAHVVASAERVGFELRDVESLREHYAMTLRHWTGGLEAHSSEAIKIAGERTYRVWRLYMAGAALGFEAGRTAIHQVLAVKTAPDGKSGMPRTREGFLTPIR